MECRHCESRYRGGRAAVLVCSFILSLCHSALGETRPVRDGKSASVALGELQERHTPAAPAFVVQDELDFLIANDGGGACPSAAAIDAVQALRLMSGVDMLAAPHAEVLARFRGDPKLLKGRLSNKQFVKLVKSYKNALNDAEPNVEVISGPHSTYATGGKTWDTTHGPELAQVPLQLQVLSFTVTEESGHVLGRHFVLLKSVKANEITVVDPTSPLKDRRYVLEFRGDDKSPAERVFLLRPVGLPPVPLTFELNTVFTISLSNSGPVAGTKEVTLASVKAEIDETVRELRGTEAFLSPREWRKRTAAAGLPGLDLPVEQGGQNWTPSQIIEVFRHAGTYNLNFRDVVGGAHVRPLLKSKSPEVLDVVRDVAAGKKYVAIAITEPQAGSDIPSIASKAEKVEGGYRISGQKRFNARLDQADFVIIFTQGTTGKEGELSVFLVPIDTKGLQIERLTAHGLTGNSYGGLRFKDLFVPESHLIGEDGQGSRVFFDHFLYWRLMQTAAAIGTGEDALKQMAERLKTRQAFGGPIGRFTHLQQPLGQHTTELKMAWSLAKEAAGDLDKGRYREARGTICGLKAEGVEIALRATDAATRAFGGEGYSTLVDLGDRLRDLNGLRIADGTTDVMRMDVVRSFYGKEFWEMAIEVEK